MQTPRPNATDAWQKLQLDGPPSARQWRIYYILHYGIDIFCWACALGILTALCGLFGCAVVDTTRAFNPKANVHSIGQYGYQSIPTRDVVCVVDQDMLATDCSDLIPASIQSVNQAAHRELFRYRGLVTFTQGAQMFSEGTLAVMGDTLPPPAVGMTHYFFASPESHAILKVMIRLDKRIFLKVFAADPHTVVVHELLHALGFSHSEYPCSIMAPVVNVNCPQMSPADIISLHDAYGEDK